MKILISGSSGLVGSAAAQDLAAGGHAVVRLVRSHPVVGEIRWDPQAGTIDAAGLEGLDAVIHLAGESITQGRWDEPKKQRIYESRVLGTRLLCQTLARLDRKPGVLISASAIGYYGSRGEEELDESSAPGLGFLPQVCRDWEAAAQPAVEAGIHTILLRTGMVLTPAGGALAKVLPVFRCGLGGPLSSGRQFMSWITRDDLVRVISSALTNTSLQGPVNAVAPRPVTNLQWTIALSHVLHRPALLPVPGFALRAVLGPMADELLLASVRVLPRRLLDSGFQFQDPELPPALERMLRKPS